MESIGHNRTEKREVVRFIGDRDPHVRDFIGIQFLVDFAESAGRCSRNFPEINLGSSKRDYSTFFCWRTIKEHEIFMENIGPTFQVDIALVVVIRYTAENIAEGFTFGQNVWGDGNTVQCHVRSRRCRNKGSKLPLLRRGIVIVFGNSGRGSANRTSPAGRRSRGRGKQVHRSGVPWAWAPGLVATRGVVVGKDSWWESDPGRTTDH